MQREICERGSTSYTTLLPGQRFEKQSPKATCTKVHKPAKTKATTSHRHKTKKVIDTNHSGAQCRNATTPRNSKALKLQFYVPPTIEVAQAHHAVRNTLMHGHFMQNRQDANKEHVPRTSNKLRDYISGEPEYGECRRCK